MVTTPAPPRKKDAADRRPDAARRSRVLLATLVCASCISLDLPPNLQDGGNGGHGGGIAGNAGDGSGGAYVDGGLGAMGGSGGPGTTSNQDAAGGTLGPEAGGEGGAIGVGVGGTPADVLPTGGAGGGRTDASAAQDGRAMTTDTPSTQAGGSGGNNLAGAAGSALGAGGSAGDAALPDLPMPDTPAVPVPTAGLVVYYPCDQAEGSNLHDQSGNNNTGILHAAASPDSSYEIEAGKIGNGLTLIQSGSGYISVPATAFKDASELTVAAWVKLNTVTTWQRLFDIGINANLSQNAATGTAYITLFLKDFNGKLGLSTTKDGFGSAIQVMTDAIATGVWKHVAIVLASSGGTIYTDGVASNMVGSILTPQAIGAIDYAFIGRSQFTADPFIDAEIDEFRVYNRALSAAEVQALFQYSGQ